MTVGISPSLRLYRSPHRIADQDGYCAVDGIRVMPVKGGRKRHDPSVIAQLVDNEHHGAPWDNKAWTEAAAVEVARDIIREDLYPLTEMVVEERQGYAVTVDVECPDCAYYKAHGGPAHEPSPLCQSGKRPHCTCSACFD